MTKEQLCREVRTSYSCILMIQENAELYFSQLQAALARNTDCVYGVLMSNAFACYLKLECGKVLNGTDCFLGLKSISSLASECGSRTAFVFCEKELFPYPEEKSITFQQFCRLLSGGLRFCETLLQEL